MLILFSDKELAEACMNPQAGQRRWGKSVYTKIVKRLSEFGLLSPFVTLLLSKALALRSYWGRGRALCRFA